MWALCSTGRVRIRGPSLRWPAWNCPHAVSLGMQPAGQRFRRPSLRCASPRPASRRTISISILLNFRKISQSMFHRIHPIGSASSVDNSASATPDSASHHVVRDNASAAHSRLDTFPLMSRGAGSSGAVRDGSAGETDGSMARASASARPRIPLLARSACVSVDVADSLVKRSSRVPIGPGPGANQATQADVLARAPMSVQSAPPESSKAP